MEISVVASTWSKPPTLWVKCNIGISWSKRNQFLGGAWVLRDEKGTVLLHSRRCFTNQSSLDEANLVVVLWAVECMGFHMVNMVIFASDISELVGATTKPKAWPSFSAQSGEIYVALEQISSWKFFLENKETNRGAFLIAQSVSKDKRIQSYVSVSFPFWLKEYFVNGSA